MSAPPSNANPWDTFGFGPRARSMAGAVAALSDNYEATYYNPAGLIESEGINVGFGYMFADPVLKIDGADTDVESTSGIEFGFVVPSKRLGAKIALGAGVHIPMERIVRFLVLSREHVRFAMYANSSQRIAVNLPFGIQVTDWLSLGGGMHFIGDNAGGIDFKIGQEGYAETEGSLTASQIARFAPLAGLLIKPVEGVRVGVGFRGQLDIELNTPIMLRFDEVYVDPVPVPLLEASLLDVTAITITHFSPNQVAVGCAWTPFEGLNVEADFTWMNWSAYIPDIPQTTTVFTGGLADLLPPIPEFPVPDANFKDTFVPAVGFEYRALSYDRFELMLRGGYSFRPTPVPDQTGDTSLVDSDVHLFSFGTGFVFRNLTEYIKKPISFDTSFQYLSLVDRVTMKDNPASATGPFESSGYVFNVGGGFNFKF